MTELTDGEWEDLRNLICKVEICLKTVLGATLCNWSCLMNSFYKETEPNPHLHIHVRPRYPTFTRVEQIIMDIAQNRELIYDISPREFEAVIERVLQDEGFETKLTQQTRDGGRDIIATKYEMGKPVVFYIECKRYGRQNSVGVNIVRSLYGVQSADQIKRFS